MATEPRPILHEKEPLSRYASFLVVTLIAVAAILIVLSVSGLVSWPGGDEAPRKRVSSEPSRRPLRLFDPDSVWNRPLPSSAPLDPSSEPAVARLNREVERELQEGIGPWIDASRCSAPLHVVSAGQAAVHVRLTDSGESWRAGLARAFRRVPMPPGAEPSDCSDAQLTVWQPETDKLWEFFHLRKEKKGWQADWGGAMRNVSLSGGFYDSHSWAGLSTSDWGATATSLPVAAGIMRIVELREGTIDHALAMNVPTARAGEFSWPAQRTDGIGSASDLAEGARLRLDPDLDLASLDLPPLTRAMAEAAQKFGIVVRDQTGPGNGISFFGEPSKTQSRPYARAGGFYGGMTPTELLSSFPWTHLELLKMNLCRSGPCRR